MKMMTAIQVLKLGENMYKYIPKFDLPDVNKYINGFNVFNIYKCERFLSDEDAERLRQHPTHYVVFYGSESERYLAEQFLNKVASYVEENGVHFLFDDYQYKYLEVNYE